MNKDKIEIPFGAFDSKLCGWEYTIPDGFEAEIKDGKVIVRKADGEDEKIRKWIYQLLEELSNGENSSEKELMIIKAQDWLEKQVEQKPTAEEVLIKAGLKPYKDGDQWCVLLGDNIQEGICGFGNTIEDALYAFLKDLIASQGEQKSTDNIEPKFKVRDWLVENEPNNYARFVQILEVVDVQGKERYRISRDLHNDEDIVECRFIENNYHLFDIQDAKDGDVLACPVKGDCSEKIIFILRRLIDADVECYCCIDAYGDFDSCINTSNIIGEIKDNDYTPATKEQRERLEKAMADAGYKWNPDEKKLEEIEKNPVIEMKSAEESFWYACW